MDPKDKLESDFEFYHSFFELNLNELRDENDKALCQEWLQRLREMTGPRKRRRDRNIYLSHLALAMAEGRLYPPFDEPPPAEPAPLPSSLFVLLPPSAQVSETLSRNRSDTSRPSSRADTSVTYWPNLAFGKEKSTWNIDLLETADEIVAENSQTPVSDMSLLGIFDKGMDQMSQTSSVEDESRWINDLLSRPSQFGSQNQLTLLSESSSLYSRFGAGMEQFSDTVTDVKTTWSSDESLDDDEFVFRNQRTPLREGPTLYSRVDSRTKRLPESVNEDEKKKQPNDKVLAADELPSTSTKPSAPPTGAPPSISSDDIIEERSPTIGNKLEESNQSNLTVSTVGELELDSTNLSDSLSVVKTEKKLDQQQPKLYSTNLSDSQTNMLSKAMNRAKKRTDFQRPESQLSNLFSHGRNTTSKDQFNPDNKLDMQRDKLHSTYFSDSPATVLFKAKFNMEKDLDQPKLHPNFFPNTRTNVLFKAKFNEEKDLDRPVVSRTCPAPSQMPLVLSGVDSRLTVDSLVATQWRKFFEQDKDVSHGTSFASLLSYSKGQWLDKPWTRDGDSFMSFLSAATSNLGEINSPSGSPSVHNEPRPPIRQSEVIIQSLSLQSLQDESLERAPAISSTSVVSTGKHEYSLLPAGETEDSPTPSSEQEDLIIPARKLTTSLIPARKLKNSPMPAGEREHTPLSTSAVPARKLKNSLIPARKPKNSAMPAGERKHAPLSASVVSTGKHEYSLLPEGETEDSPIPSSEQEDLIIPARKLTTSLIPARKLKNSPMPAVEREHTPMSRGEGVRDQSTQTQCAQHSSPMPTIDSGQDQFTQTQSAQHFPQEKRFPEQPLYLPIYVISNQQPYFLYTPVMTPQIEGHQFIIPTIIHLPNTPQQSE